MKFITIPGSFSEQIIDTFNVVSETSIDYCIENPDCLKDRDDIRIKLDSENLYDKDVMYAYSKESFKIDKNSAVFISFNFTHYTELNIVKKDDIDYNDHNELNQKQIVGFNSYKEILDYDKKIALKKYNDIQDSDIITLMIIGTEYLNIYINGYIFFSHKISLEPCLFNWQIVCGIDNYISSDFMNGKFYYYESGIFQLNINDDIKNICKTNVKNLSPTDATRLLNQAKIKLKNKTDLFAKEFLMTQFPYQIKIMNDGLFSIKQDAIVDYEKLNYKFNKEKRKKKSNYERNKILEILKFNNKNKGKFNYILCPSYNCNCNHKNCPDKNFIKFKDGYTCPGSETCKYFHYDKYPISVKNINKIKFNKKTKWFSDKYDKLNTENNLTIDKLNHIIEIKEENINNLLKINKLYKNKIKDSELQIELLKEKPSILESELDEKIKQIDTLNKHIKNITLQFDENKKKMVDLENKNKKLENNLEIYQNYPKVKTSLNKKENENKKLLDKIQVLNKKLEEKDTEIKDKEKEIEDRDAWNEEKKQKITKLSNYEKEYKKIIKEKIPEYESIIENLNEQIEYISTIEIIEAEKLKYPKSESRIKIKIDGIDYDDKHIKWRKSDSKILHIFQNCLHDSRKIKTLISKCGWIEERHSKHITYSRIINGNITQKFVCPTTPSEWHTTWIILKRLEEKRIQLELE